MEGLQNTSAGFNYKEMRLSVKEEFLKLPQKCISKMN